MLSSPPILLQTDSLVRVSASFVFIASSGSKCTLEERECSSRPPRHSDPLILPKYKTRRGVLLYHMIDNSQKTLNSSLSLLQLEISPSLNFLLFDLVNSLNMVGRKVYLPLEKLDKCSVCGRTDLKLRWCMSCAEVWWTSSRGVSAQLNFHWQNPLCIDPLLLNPMSNKGLEITQDQLW